MPATQTTEFTQAVEQSRKLKAKPTDNELLELYGLYKQGTQDPPFEKSEAAGMFDFKGKAKRSAWEKVNQAGTSAEDAQKQYVELVNKLVEKYGSL
ncbi:hypothetical protein AMS68_006695 [Peltaster fructicola]|uniref:ACB domain-containing protein n=1 Tax=Peltaster fructicola TaxID=286661 RepID=A0A6H0Y2V0_9PEZI|nr:hypothetical protein AMS68_006695 [Peltaster fructicola]